ncbi:MAG: hypothetical protein MMC23_000073 [Stictis urceolatum]|nr:hypothetical protein [Stictis urceolata]
MLITPRLYQQSQGSGKELWSAIREQYDPGSSWHDLPRATIKYVQKMRLVHQTGSVKVGGVVRYTLTYTPSRDRIVPTPQALHIKIKNSSAIALRAAYLHGPYTLYAACYPSSFDPNTKHELASEYGSPQFEPNLKAGGTWNAQLKVPEELRETTLATEGHNPASPGGSITWVIDVTSQVLFSNSATVQYEILVGRDEKSVDFGFAGMGGVHGTYPGVLSEHLQTRKSKNRSTQTRGVYSEAISLAIDDTASLWNTPELPEADEERELRGKLRANPVLRHTDPEAVDHEDFRDLPKKVDRNNDKPSVQKRKRQRVHLVLVTHGLHSNLGADMLYMKESIDAAAKQARLDRQMRRAKRKASLYVRDEADKDGEAPNDDEDEQVIVRGYPGNAIRTERGIQYLGKRLAKYVLAMTYPDQPYLPVKKKSMSSSISKAFGGSGGNDQSRASTGQSSHSHSTIRKEHVPETNLAYKITSISFIGHSLGGLTQTYAVAYIQKHSPEFFQLIKPINFVALASPFLGLSNENPLYVKFALNFGLVGRTGQDLGLTWRAPTMVRSGWGAMIAGMGDDAHRKQRELNPGSKPLLRILPSGPAHQALRLFRNRTVYSNVVNDGIVPLRTSCLLFLDWRGLGRVEKARRENGIVGTMAGWGWAELTGANSTDQKRANRAWSEGDDSDGETSSEDRETNTPTQHGQGDDVPLPDSNATQEDNSGLSESPRAGKAAPARDERLEDEDYEARKASASSPGEQMSNPFSGFLALLKPGSSSKSSTSKSHPHPPKGSKIYKRSQTTVFDDESQTDQGSALSSRPGGPVRGESILQEDQVLAPPQTSVFEAAGDLLNPPLPDEEYINDPTSRPRTIFHDRIYHPDDIPDPPTKPRSFLRRASSQDGKSSQKSSMSLDSASSVASFDTTNMKVEEKIARAYHRDLSWRKVLVRLEPDAHNNIVVRRMFANAYGWPVVKHLVDTHFAATHAAETADRKETNVDRAKPMSEGVGEHGEEVKGQHKRALSADNRRDESEERDELSTLPGLDVSRHSSMRKKPRIARQDSASWDDRFFSSDDEDDDPDDYFESPRSPKPKLGLGIPAPGKDTDSKGGLTPDTTKPMVLPVMTASPSTARTSDVGLRKSLEEQLHQASTDQP